MKHAYSFSLFLAACLALGTKVQAKTVSQAYRPYSVPTAPTLALYDFDPDYVYPIDTRTGQYVHIVLAPDEKAISLHLADDKRWVYYVTQTRQDIFVLGKVDDLATVGTIITDKRSYELYLRTKPKGTYYQRVSWHYPGLTMMASGGQVSEFGVEFAAAQRAGEPNAADAAGGADGTNGMNGSGGLATPAGPRIDLAHANFDYRIQGDAPFRPTMVLDDGRFTYFRLAENSHLPAVFVLSEDGTAEITNLSPVGNGYWRLRDRATYGVLLKRGKQEVKIMNGKGAGCGVFGCTRDPVRNFIEP